MTNKLDRSSFERACEFVRREGRLLDAELLNHSLGADNAHAVLNELAAYQNEDGGFGHGLEPDIRTPNSTAIATSVGFQVLRKIQADSEHPMVTAGIEYLIATLNHEDWVWPIINPEVDLAPHAPWWNYSEDLADSWNKFRFNPTAELVGYCFEHANRVPANVLDQLTITIVENIEKEETLDSFYDLRCCLKLHATGSIPEQVREPLEQLIRQSVCELSPDDPHVNYLNLVPKPGFFLAATLTQQFDVHIEKVIQSQADDGSWGPWWEWREVSENEWQKAEREWSGVITRETISTLAAHDLIS